MGDTHQYPHCSQKQNKKISPFASVIALRVPASYLYITNWFVAMLFTVRGVKLSDHQAKTPCQSNSYLRHCCLEWKTAALTCIYFFTSPDYTVLHFFSVSSSILFLCELHIRAARGKKQGTQRKRGGTSAYVF